MAAGARFRALAALAALGAVAGEPRRPVLAATAPREAVVRVLSPPDVAGVKGGLLAVFSSAPSAKKELTARTQAGNPLGCLEYSPRPSGATDSYVSVVRRGNCSFLLKAQLAKAAGAEGLVVVGDNESYFIMGGDDAPEDVGIFAVGVQKSFGDAILSQLETQPAMPVIMSFELYEKGVWDLAEAMLVLFATTIVGVGALVSTSDLRASSPFAPQQGDRIVEIDNKMAVGFCVGGSITLMVCFFLMQYLIYFIIFGFCLASVLNFVEIGSLSLQHFVPSLRGRTLEVGRVSLRIADIAATVPSVALGITWLVLKEKPQGWFPQDIMGFGFLCWVQRTIRVPNLKVATLLLSVMFFFDIFWVFLSPIFFGTSVMVKVATGGNSGQTVPMLFRIPAFGDPLGSERMLGFGDIVIPGLLVSYLRRHDVLSRRRIWDGYFGPALVGYLVGLCATLVSLMIMKMGQPALLYLVPGTLGTTLVLATRRKELSHLWHAVPVLEGSADLQSGLTEIAARVNDESVCVRLGTTEGFQDRYYCGRNLGTEAIPGSDGRCGPDDGPQCPSCARFQAARTPAPAGGAAWPAAAEG